MKRDSRSNLTVAAVLCGLLLSAGPRGTVAQSRNAVAMENSLLGVRLLQSYRVVLQKYGQPTRVYAFDQPCGLDYALNSRGLPTGGIKNVYDLGGAGGGAGPSLAASSGSPYGGVAGGGPRAGMGMGMPGSGGLPTFPGGRMGGGLRQDDDESERGMMGGPPRGMGMPGSAGGLSGAPAGLGGSPFMGMPMAGGSALSGLMGTGMPGSGGPVAAGASGPAGIPGSAMGGGMLQSGRMPTFADSGGFYWVYVYPRKEIVNMFFFNKDGRVIAIAHMGEKNTMRTRRGVSLGMPVRTVYAQYGWPNSMAPQEQGILSMFYNEKHHAQFDILNNRVVGIAVVLNESMKILRGAGGSGSAGTGRLAGGMPGAPGMSGMPGMPGGAMGGRTGGGGGGSAAAAAY